MTPSRGIYRKAGMPRFPRTCRNGHTISGPEDEYNHRSDHRKCAECVRIKAARDYNTPGKWGYEYVRSGRAATVTNRRSRAQAEARDLQLLEALRGSNERRQG